MACASRNDYDSLVVILICNKGNDTKYLAMDFLMPLITVMIYVKVIIMSALGRGHPWDSMSRPVLA